MKYAFINKITEDTIEVEAENEKEAEEKMKEKAELKISTHNQDIKNWKRK
jgi:translation elongation factor P/translation initiation factor 5A